MRIFNNIKKYAVLMVAVLTVTSCNDFMDVNVNPNLLLNPPPGTILTSAQVSLGVAIGGSVHRYSALWSQQFSGQGASGTQTIDYGNYVVTEVDMNNVFRVQLFGEVLANLAQLREASQEENPVFAGIAKIMQAYTYQILVDGWGDVPYTEALQFGANPRPAYDSSRDIYTNLFSLIDEGMADLDRQNVLPVGPTDIIYGGNVDKWKRFGNALKLRLYVHYYPLFPAEASAGIASLLGQPLMRDASDNFQLRFENTAARTNPIDQFETRRQNQFFPHQTFVNTMNAKADPRRPFFFTAFPEDGQFTGAVAAPQSIDFSRIGVYLRGPRTSEDDQFGFAGDAPIRMLTVAEQNFIIAEYHARNGNVGEANIAHAAGITASMTMAGVDPAAAAAYIAASPTGTITGAGEDAIRAIIEEKWVANYGVGMEPWTDWRRTGYPELSPVAAATLPAIPRILPYSDLERVTNPQNTPARGSADLITPSVFWDPGAR
jgi:hypothetical protein